MDLKKICKRLKIRLTVKRGKKRIPKSKKVLLKQIKRKLKLQKTKFGLSGAGVKGHFKKHWKKYAITAAFSCPLEARAKDIAEMVLHLIWV